MAQPQLARSLTLWLIVLLVHAHESSPKTPCAQDTLVSFSGEDELATCVFIAGGRRERVLQAILLLLLLLLLLLWWWCYCSATESHAVDPLSQPRGCAALTTSNASADAKYRGSFVPNSRA